MPARSRVCLLLTCAVLAAPGGEEDLVRLKDGRELRGRVVFEDEATVVLRRGSRDTELRLAEVHGIESLTRALGALLDNTARSRPWDVADNELLAEQAQESGLAGEAEVLWWRVLAKEPENERAHRSLGHRKRGSGWSVPLGSRSVSAEKRLDLARDWGSAWELETLHYRLRTNLALEQALDLALGLERYYRSFYGCFARELRLFDVLSPMQIAVHADAASYPEHGAELGHYDAADDTVHVDFSGGMYWETLVHEMTHQLLYDTAVRERGNSGELPAWLDEGLAEYVAGSVTGMPATLAFEAGRPIERHFQVHARAEKPLSFSRVLNLSPGDFSASSDRELKYAQAYTLVHFALHGQDERYRGGFVRFLRGVYQGKGSSTDFKNSLGVEEREFERAWQQYVRQGR